ncbi:MAG: alpha/beta fold hydrolase BchO, partial [Pseudomonadota bacterium]
MRGLDWTRDLPAFPGPSERVEAGGQAWRVVRRGDRGPRVLLLHGAGASAHSWQGVMERLAPDHRLLAPDLPGHGFSDLGPGGRQSLPVMAAGVAALIDALEAPPDLIAGHSAGAAIALRLTLDGRAAPRAIYAVNGALTPFRGLAGVLFPPMARALAANPFTPRVAAAALAADPAAARRLITGTGSAAEPEALAL